MKKYCFLLILSTLFFFSTEAQVTPAPSPGASFSQTVGITQINVEYSRPGVKGRTIFGNLLKYGEVWRTGANAATRFEISNDVKINGQTLRAGEYAIMSFPSEEEWTVVFNTNLGTTQENYNAANNVLEVKVAPHKVDFTETFTIAISDVHEDMARLNIYWEHTGISLSINIDNEAVISAAVDTRNAEAAGAFQQAAEYLVNKDLSLNKALEYINKSISLQETFRNTWIKSVILRKNGRNTDALKLALKAQVLGADEPVYQLFKEAVESGITELRASVPSGGN